MRITNCLVLVAGLLSPGSAWCQSWPSHPVRVIVPFAPGGATDIITRVVAQKLTETWGQTVVVDNRAGAGGNIGGDIAAKSNPDGYTVLMTSGSIVAANPHLFRKMPFDPAKDLAAVTNVASGPQAIVVNPSFPAKTLKDFIAAAKAKPKGYTYGSAGVATQTHLAAENFLNAAGIDIVHVPYKGEGPALSDLLGGQIQLVTPNLAAAIGFVQQGKLRALAVTSKERVKQLPDVPAAAETLPGFENIGWFGFMVPAGTPKGIVEKLYQDTAKALQAPDIRARFEQLGMAPVGNAPGAFAKAIREESVHWGKIVRERRLQVE
ncbi:MAG TPA: tripartite tricarboxylate transporter substrate binding protein [Burkholderiales bacterium]|jgi:tripartite-type tricarboxylate transporter receptor subunit TctC|nr:tripartite tricarboxylate transporter substrate binding protein [Burkholderiales bacterium]